MRLRITRSRKDCNRLVISLFVRSEDAIINHKCTARINADSNLIVLAPIVGYRYHIMPSLRLGNIAPDFEAETTAGHINFHEWIGDSWV